MFPPNRIESAAFAKSLPIICLCLSTKIPIKKGATTAQGNEPPQPLFRSKVVVPK